MIRRLPQPKFGSESGLITVVVVHRPKELCGPPSGTILMVAHANREAYRLTLETGFAHFWSRSRMELWKKGATSGNVIPVYCIMLDCDKDTAIYYTEVDLEKLKACHEGSLSCFTRFASRNETSSGDCYEYEVSPSFD